MRLAGWLCAGMPFVSHHLSPRLSPALRVTEPKKRGGAGVSGAFPYFCMYVCMWSISNEIDLRHTCSAPRKRGWKRLPVPGQGFYVSENRLTPLLCYSALGFTILLPGVLDKIPTAASFGVLCFIGARSLIQGNEFFERVLLLLVPPADFPSGVRLTRFFHRFLLKPLVSCPD
eukprot:COSAG01_NODE_1157_length_11476_cov_87.701503_8_plen_173_part_00